MRVYGIPGGTALVLSACSLQRQGPCSSVVSWKADALLCHLEREIEECKNGERGEGGGEGGRGGGREGGREGGRGGGRGGREGGIEGSREGKRGGAAQSNNSASTYRRTVSVSCPAQQTP